MALIKSSVLILLLFATLTEILPSGLAELPTPFSGLDPPPSQFPSFDTLQQCWVSMEEMVGCYSDAYRAFLSGNLGLAIGPSCCMAFSDINSNCWSQMFPDAPSFPSSLKDYCTNYQNGQGDAPSPSVEPADV
ncbi:hypothetical protein SSX86_026215 [Deinandra increscens subsp. villosa]|uniref:Prolamin-like domain-containing protein n=1 Tax=Deinandra increscens subsp. villosa TaxID=3103831 RepID=A0AAP0CKQ0_9ASTR